MLRQPNYEVKYFDGIEYRLSISHDGRKNGLAKTVI